ncbi:Dabb family protein [Nocardia sp. NBC_00416]|uniref:Dabb family protein n=1 Tax=Nocardia sp. NBC_00416 TaxID=2975991 RepID=UPI002E1F63EB
MTTDIAPGEVSNTWFGGAEVTALREIAAGVTPLRGRRIKRTLLLSVDHDASQPQIERFESELIAMTEHISAIRSWALSRADTSRSNSGWTHIWEQEFDDTVGLEVDYLLHPYHWTRVDRWFDPEIPDSIVEPGFAHLYRWAEGPVLGAHDGSS